MRILGIDPGSNITGFGVIDIINKNPEYVASGSINISRFNLQEKMGKIYLSVFSIVSKYSPNMTAIESVFLFKNPNSALKLSQARGAALAAIGVHGLPLMEYSPREVKKYSSGYGGSDKDSVKKMVVNILGLSGFPQADAADALGVAICCWVKDKGFK